MAYEAVLVTRTEHPVSMTVANATGIEKGAILKMSDPNTAATTTGAVDIVAGIAAAEKIASDGVTQLAVYKGGRFKVYLSGSCTVGDPLVTDFNNYVKTGANVAVGVISGSRVLGRALETGTTGETILMELNLGLIGGQG